VDFKSRPTFGAKVPEQVEIKSKSDRPEMGAVWKKLSKNNTEYMNIRLKLSKEKLQELLKEEGDVVSVNFVAFPNRTVTESPNRPNFRVYEELLKENT